MKRAVLALLSLSALLLPLSCEKKESGTPGSETFTTVNTPARQESFGHALRLTGLYDIKDGKATWKASTFLGEKFTLTGEKTEADVNGYKYDLTQVTRITGDTLWVIDMTFAANGELAVVTSDEPIFLATAPQAATYTKVGIDRLQLIVVFPETEKSNFVKTSLYIPNKEDPAKVGTYFGYDDRSTRYIRNNVYSIREDDVQSAILYHTAMASDNEEQKKALLQSALSDYPNSVFERDIRSALNPEGPGLETEAVTIEMQVSDDWNAPVFAKPSFDAVRVGAVQAGELITLVERSIKTVTADTETDYWYRIEEPLEGWIFGGRLVEYEPVGDSSSDDSDEDWM